MQFIMQFRRIKPVNLFVTINRFIHKNISPQEASERLYYGKLRKNTQRAMLKKKELPH